ncbi:MAG TPA: type II toxin-antitoxin system HipA family toxin [Gammaproteobacteria bacterium]
MTTVAAVKLWGRHIGAVSQQDDRDYAAFQYQPEFAASGIEIAPIVMPLANRVYVFPELPRVTFRGLPGLLADSLPDKFGNALIDAWLAAQGRSPASFNAVERLCYTGTRGMGALEFEPATGPEPDESDRIEVAALVELASRVLARQSDLHGSLAATAERASLTRILQVGTSAGGARAKAVIAWNPHTNEVRSGQVEAGTGFEHWLLKFDGVRGNRDKELEDPAGYGAIEYAYHGMAEAAGITMSPCRLLEENGRRHFMAKRFDRTDGGGKIHMQSLGALGHYDYNSAGANSYEQAFAVMRKLGLPMMELEQQYRRMTFNIVARNQDDHVKNIAFLMDKQGRWSLAPAFDVTYSYNPEGLWTAVHQMSVNGKRDAFTLEDFKACARAIALKRGRAESILAEVRDAVAQWPKFAARARVSVEQAERIRHAQRLEIPLS